jgi:hypothetical protein
MRPARSTALAAALGILALAGCGEQPITDGAPATPVQSSSAAESGTSQSLNAATQALVDHATVSTTGDQPKGIAARTAAVGETGYLSRLDLTSTASVDLDVQLEDIENAAGGRKYPNLSGHLIVHADGEVVSSWPSGTTTLAHHTVTVTYDHVSYHDPECGATATVVSGSYTYDLVSDYHYAAPENWTAAFDAELSIPSTTPLLWQVSRGEAPVRTVSVFGVRDGHLRYARSNDTHSGGSTNRLVVDAQIDGTHGDPATSTTIDGVTGIDPAASGDSYTNWDFTVDGTDHLVWNRRAILHAQWDFAPGGASLSLSGTDKVYITHNGTQIGPYTAGQLRVFFHCRLDD